MTLKVQLIGTQIIGLCVAEALKAMGVQVHLRHYGTTNAVKTVSRRMLHNFYEEMRHREYNKAIRRALAGISPGEPGMVLVLKRTRLDENTRELLRQPRAVLLVLWTLDSLQRYPNQNDLARYADHRFYIDEVDAAGEHAHWLPLGYDDRFHRPLPIEEKDIDVLFVGYLRQPDYANRLAALLELAKSEIPSRAKVAFLGTSGDRQSDGELRARLESIQCFGRQRPADYGRIISRSRIVINVHQNDGVWPVNPTFFAIPGGRSCQVAENRDYLGRWLEPGREYVPFQPDRLIETVSALLDNPARVEEVAAAGHERAAREHTFQARLRQITEIALA